MPADPSIPVYQLRGYPVALDADLAQRFGLKTGPFNQTIKRNADRFSEDFAFPLTAQEWGALKSQDVMSSGHGGRRTVPWAFTEHGVVMAATLLRTETAIAASRVIVRSFVAARRAEALRPEGTNIPLQIDLAQRLPTADGKSASHVLARRAAGMIDRILDTIANDEEGTTVREEGRAILTKSLGAIRAHLDAKGIANEKTVAEIRKTLTEIEAIDTDIIARQIEADHRRLAYLAKQMQLVIAAQTYLETGEATGFLETLRAISGQ
jgi:hypothetical protein